MAATKREKAEVIYSADLERANAELRNGKLIHLTAKAGHIRVVEENYTLSALAGLWLVELLNSSQEDKWRVWGAVCNLNQACRIRVHSCMKDFPTQAEAKALFDDVVAHDGGLAFGYSVDINKSGTRVRKV